MNGGRGFVSGLLILMGASVALAQEPAFPSVPNPRSNEPAKSVTLEHRPKDAAETPLPPPKPVSETVNLTIPKGTPLEVALDREVRVGRAGEAISGKVIEPIYAFDKVVVPAGSTVTGKIDRVDGVSAGKRTAAALDANFTPNRKVHVTFDQLTLPGGKIIPIQTDVTPGTGQRLQLITAGGNSSEKKSAKDAASQKVEQAKQEARQEWQAVMSQVQSPGKMHRVVRYTEAQLPVHAQYMEAGTTFTAELQVPLDFGTEPLTPEMAESITSAPPDGTVVHALLMTPLSSATTPNGTEVDAVVSRPEFDGTRLVVPQGSVLKGSVVQVEPARMPGRNGKLRIVYHQLELPGGTPEKVDAILAGVQADSAANMSLDTEGGASAASPNSRFITTAITVGLGAYAFIGDSGGGDLVHSSAGGAGGFKLIGIAIGLATRSQVYGMAMGAFGGARSIYTNFIARGHDVVFPKNTVMEIGIATRLPNPGTAPNEAPGATKSAAPTSPSKN